MTTTTHVNHDKYDALITKVTAAALLDIEPPSTVEQQFMVRWCQTADRNYQSRKAKEVGWFSSRLLLEQNVDFKLAEADKNDWRGKIHWKETIFKAHIHKSAATCLLCRIRRSTLSGDEWCRHLRKNNRGVQSKPKLLSTGPQRESGSVVDWRQPGKELRKQKWRRWTTAGAPSNGWPVTDRGGGALLVPYMSAGVRGSDDDDVKDKSVDRPPSLAQLFQTECSMDIFDTLNIIIFIIVIIIIIIISADYGKNFSRIGLISSLNFDLRHIPSPSTLAESKCAS